MWLTIHLQFIWNFQVERPTNTRGRRLTHCERSENWRRKKILCFRLFLANFFLSFSPQLFSLSAFSSSRVFSSLFLAFLNQKFWLLEFLLPTMCVLAFQSWLLFACLHTAIQACPNRFQMRHFFFRYPPDSEERMPWIAEDSLLSPVG